MAKLYTYKFTAEIGPEDFPTLGFHGEKDGDTVVLDYEVDHPRLQLVSSEEVTKKEAKQKITKPQSVTKQDDSPAKAAEVAGAESEEK